MDYIQDKEKTYVIFCRKAIYDTIYNRLRDSPNHVILKLSAFSYLVAVLYLIHSRSKGSRYIFTPSCHPIPLLDNNCIVVHDSFPFDGYTMTAMSRKLILYSSLLLCDCKIGYINHSNALKFANRIKSIRLRGFHTTIYLPNIPPSINISKMSYRRKMVQPYQIGLCGTNSSKKNYHKLVKNLVCNGIASCDIEFIVFGFDTPYIRSVMEYSPYSFTILDSSTSTFEEFLSSIDLLVNTSSDEGYCRPVAAATKAGIPVHLLDSPTLREFYNSSHSEFYETIADIAIKLKNMLAVHQT